jgi:hypothetical protein
MTIGNNSTNILRHSSWGNMTNGLVNHFQYRIMTIRPRLADIWLMIYLVMNTENQGVKNSSFFLLTHLWI